MLGDQFIGPGETRLLARRIHAPGVFDTVEPVELVGAIGVMDPAQRHAHPIAAQPRHDDLIEEAHCAATPRSGAMTAGGRATRLGRGAAVRAPRYRITSRPR